MNGWLVLIGAALLAGCGGDVTDAPPLAGAKMGGPFALTGEDGRVVKDSDFAGRYRLVYFGYTYCPDVCPVDMQRLMQGLAALEQSAPQLAQRIQPLFISVDPERDTPAALREFTTAFHPRLLGLTGTIDEVRHVANAYGVYFQKGKENAPGAYLVDHNRNTTLYGPKGEPIALIDTQGSPAQIADEIRRWVR